MIPLYDTVPSRRAPIINWVIIWINALVFIFEASLSPQEREVFLRTFGLVPKAISDPEWAIINGYQPYAYWTFLTNMFLHGSWLHFFSNVWTLWIFGDNVEDRMGPVRYFIFYILTGILASATHYVMYMSSTLPAIGASGAISGVMGAYIFLFPYSTIIFFIPVFFLPYFVEISAFVYVFFWFVGQFFAGIVSITTMPDKPGIAFWAHIGGFVAGILLYKFFIPKKREIYNDEFGQEFSRFHI